MYELFKARMSNLGSYSGESKRINSRKIMETSWLRDAATKPVYVKWINSGLPVVDENDHPVFAKFKEKSYHNITGDEVAYLLQFKLDDIKTNPNIRVGSYVQIENELGEPEWWLIVHFDSRNQFREYSILKCSWTFKWVAEVSGKRKIYECLGVPRKQNSYNSGVWLDYLVKTVENQELLWLPTNDDTRTIQYGTKFLKSADGRYPAIKWSVSKIEDTALDGVSKFTMAQEQFDPSKDNAELMIADYYKSYVEPEVEEIELAPTVKSLKIAYSGMPTVRAGGGYKKFTLKTLVDDKFVDAEGNVNWVVDFNNNDDKIECIVKDNILKVKCKNDYSLIGKTFNITANHEHSKATIIVEIISL